MAIAAVQGSWNKATKAVLMTNMRNQLGLDEAAGSAMEKVMMNAVGKMAESLMGEGSMSHVLFGKSLVLPAHERGLIVLGNIFGVLGSEDAHDWETTALLVENARQGENFEKTILNLKKGFERFNTGILGMMRSFAFPGDEINDESSGEGVISHLQELYGGSSEALFMKKQTLEEKLVMDLEKRLGSLSAFEIQKKIECLDMATDDKMISESLKNAKEIIKEILKRRSEDIKKLLETI